MRGDLVIRGDSLEEQMQSVKQVVEALNKKPIRTEIKVLANSFLTVELPSPGIVYKALLVKPAGFLTNFLIYIQETKAKNLVVQLNIQEESEMRTVLFPVKEGFNRINKDLKINEVSFISLSYSMEEGVITTPPVVGFTFKEEITNANPIES